MPTNLIIYGGGKCFSKDNSFHVTPVIGQPVFTEDEEDTAEARFYEDRRGLSEVDTSERQVALPAGAAEETEADVEATSISTGSMINLSLAELRRWKTNLETQLTETQNSLNHMACRRVPGLNAAKKIENLNTSIPKLRQLINQIDDVINHRTPDI